MHTCFLLFVALGKGQSDGIEESRSKVEEVTVEQTACQQNTHSAAQECLFFAVVAEQQPQGLESVETVGAYAQSAAADQQLQDGIVPPGRDQR